jgi:soluble lytic murein transglycosylase-like protein
MPERSSVIGLTGACLLLLILSMIATPTPSLRAQRLLGLSLGALLLLLAWSGSAWALEPERARQYKEYLIQIARQTWGLDAPVMLFAGQIQQESGWNPEARSAYACGLTQFTPETMEWIAQEYRVDVGKGSCTDARWAIRAMVRYDKHLSDAITKTKDDCTNRRFMLSAYNGGLGWVVRDRAKAVAQGLDAGDYDAVSPINAGRSQAAFSENRAYPGKIVGHQKNYEAWGGPQTCQEVGGDSGRYQSVVRNQRSVDPWRCAGVDRLICRLVKAR